jgi:hypothetical protein
LPSVIELDAYRLSAVGQLLDDARESRHAWRAPDPLADAQMDSSASPNASADSSTTPLPYPTAPANPTQDLPDLPSFGVPGGIPESSDGVPALP